MFEAAGGDPQIVGGYRLAFAAQRGIDQGIQIGCGRSAGNHLHARHADELRQLATVGALPLSGGEAAQQLPQHGGTYNDGGGML